MTHLVAQWLAAHGYTAVFVLLLLGLVGLPVPDEFVLSSAGVLASKGRMDLLPAIGWASVGTWLGLTLSYGVGRAAGAPLLRRLGKAAGATDKADRALQWFQGMGKWSLFFGYFIPGVKHILAIAAGTTRFPLRDFVRFAYTGAVLWTAAYVLVGYFLGEEWARASAHAHHAIRMGVRVAALALLAAYLIRAGLARRRGSPGPPGGDGPGGESAPEDAPAA